MNPDTRIQDIHLGRVLGGKYQLTHLLGQGGMGAVYEARHALIGRRFAIKLLHAPLASDPDMLVRFKREALAAGALENENVAAVTDFGAADDGAPYIVMEFLQGEDLARLVRRVGPLPVPRAVGAVIQACRGIEVAHSAGVVHRDLKPENLFVTRRGDGTDLVKVLDFGIAKLSLGESVSSTRTGVALGTPSYMPPEQARGQRDVDHRADIYALGVILYEVLSGHKPHAGDSYNEILYKILTQDPTRLEALRPRLPAGLADVVHKAMARVADARFQRVSDLIAGLTPFAAPRIIAAGQSVGTVINVETVVTDPDDGVHTHSRARMAPRRIEATGVMSVARWKRAFIIAAMAICAVGAGVLWTSRRAVVSDPGEAVINSASPRASLSTIPTSLRQPIRTVDVVASPNVSRVEIAPTSAAPKLEASPKERARAASNPSTTPHPRPSLAKKLLGSKQPTSQQEDPYAP